MKNKNIIPSIVKDKNQLSKLQKDFNKQIAQIQKWQEKLANLSQQKQTITQRIAEELTPLEQQVAQARCELAKFVVERAKLVKLTATQRKGLAEYLTGECWDLIDTYGFHELEDIYHKYNTEGMSYEEEKEFLKNQEKSQMSDFFKLFFNKDVQFEDKTEEEIATMMNQMAAEAQQEKKEKEWKKNQKLADKQKQGKISEREAKRLAETDQINKLLRSIYTELVKEIHPDLEQDAKRRAEKTEMMKAITNAYEAQDLYTLMWLQLEHQKSQQNLAEMPEERLKYYVKILKQQVKSLEDEFYTETSALNPFNRQLTELGYGKSDAHTTKLFSDAIAEMHQNLKQIANTTEDIKSDREFKQWIQSQYSGHRTTVEMEISMLDIVDIFKNMKHRR